MKYRAFIMFVALGLAVSCIFANGVVGAQGADSAKGNVSSASWKIGVVDRKQVFDKYNKQIAETAKLEKEVKQKQDELDALSQPIQKAKDDYEAKRESMTQEQRDVAKQKIQADFAAYQAQLKAVQTDLEGKNALLLKQMRTDIDAAIAKYGEENKYHLILECDQDPRSSTSVLYFCEAIDITSDIILALNGKQ